MARNESANSAAQLHTRGCPSDQLGKWLCNSIKLLTFMPNVPAGGIARFILDNFLASNNPLGNDAWKTIKPKVEEYLNEVINENLLHDIKGKLEGYHVTNRHCQRETTGQSKTRCLHGLFNSMLQGENAFKGNTMQKQSILLKYFDRYVILFNALSKELQDSIAANPPSNGSIRIDFTFRERQCSFYNYMCEARLQALMHGCRHIHVILKETGLSFGRTKDLGYKFPPQRCSDINLDRKRDFISDFELEGSDNESGSKRGMRGCGPLRKSRDYTFYIYNSKTGEEIEKSSFSSCGGISNDVLIKCQSAMNDTVPYLEKCWDNYEVKFEEGLQDRIKGLKTLTGWCNFNRWCRE